MPINTSMNRWSRIASNMDIESLSLNHRIGSSKQTSTGSPQFGKNITGTKQFSKTGLPRLSSDTLSNPG